jgi:hypothetical protein
MTHRIDIRTAALVTTVLIQGLLDRAAFDELSSLCRSHRLAGRSVHVVLGAGIRVHTDLVEALVRIEGVTIDAESAFLSRWIRDLEQSTVHDKRSES